MRIASASLWLVTICAPVPGVSAQVIEIDAAGGATTYDRPMTFLESAAQSITDDADAPVGRMPIATSVTDVGKIHGLAPGLLEAVAWQESRGRMSAISPKGALGVMQLMPATAAELGVDPRNLADNLRGGALYLRRQIDRFGSIPLALAAYNAGPNAVVRHGGIPPYRETRAYVSSIIARWRSAGANAETTARPVTAIAISSTPLLIEVQSP